MPEWPRHEPRLLLQSGDARLPGERRKITAQYNSAWRNARHRANLTARSTQLRGTHEILIRRCDTRQRTCCTLHPQRKKSSPYRGFNECLSIGSTFHVSPAPCRPRRFSHPEKCSEKRSEMRGKAGQNWTKLEVSPDQRNSLPIRAFRLFSVGCGDQPEMLPKQASYRLSHKRA